MIISRTEIDYREQVNTWIKFKKGQDVHYVSKKRITYRFLFIPIVVIEKITSSSI